MDLDVVILGTGLSQSITAAALSKAGYKVAHVDCNSYYGGEDASLTLDELVTWAEARSSSSPDSSPFLVQQRTRISSISYSGSIQGQSRQYAVSLQPTIIPAIGPLIDCLVASGVSRYGGFKLLERVALFDKPGFVKPVPGNKEDVFKDKQLSLLHKRRLMRFLMFAGGDFESKVELEGSEQIPFAAFLRDKFSLDEEATQVIVYALAFCISPQDHTLPALRRVRRYLRSTGRYGPSPFLVGHYGGLGEIAQGFCRSSAVGGSTYVLGRCVSSVNAVTSPAQSTRKYAVRLEDLPEELYCDVLVYSEDYAQFFTPLMGDVAFSESNSRSFARCVAIIDKPVSFSSSEVDPDVLNVDAASYDKVPESSSQMQNSRSEVDTALLVFPPGCIEGGSTATAVNVLITGEGSMTAPSGKWILHFYMAIQDSGSATQSPEGLLQPYLDATLSLLSPRSPETNVALSPVFSLFYMQHCRIPETKAQSAVNLSPGILYSESYSPFLPEIADSAATQGESMFWSAVRALKAAERYPRQTDRGGDVDAMQDLPREVESFWPPLEHMEDEEDW